MKSVRFLLMLAAFLLVISSSITLWQSMGEARPIAYINIAAMVLIAIAITLIVLKSRPKDYL